MSERMIIRTTGSTGPSGTGSVTATDVAFTPAGTIAATNVQTAVAEVATDAASALSTHESDTTNVHGIADTSALETTTGSASKVSTHAALTSSVHGISAFGATLVDDADASAARTTLGLVIGTNVQAFDSDLSTIAAANNGAVLAATTASFTTADETKLDGIAAGATVYTDEMARDALGTALVAGSNITITPNDGSDTITIAAAGGSTVPVGGVVRILTWEVPSATSGTWTLSGSTSYHGGAVFFTTSGNGSYAEWSRHLDAGTYALVYYYATVNDAGIVKVSIDGTTVVTVDQYSAGTVTNLRSSTTGIVVGSSGTKTIRVFSDGKNASSSGFAIRLLLASLERTA